MEVKKQLTASSYVISGITYKVTPFAAMNAVAVMGTLTSLLVPVLQLAVPAVKGVMDKKGTLDVDAVEKNITLDNLGDAIRGLSGDQMVRLFNDLLLKYSNVIFLDKEKGNELTQLDIDTFNELFCQNLGAAVNLCIKVISLNYSNFFDGFGIQFGDLMQAVKVKTRSPVMASLT